MVTEICVLLARELGFDMGYLVSSLPKVKVKLQRGNTDANVVFYEYHMAKEFLVISGNSF